MPHDPDLLGRFWSKVDIRGDDECWEWRAARDPKNGYGRFGIHPKTFGAHNLAWILTNAEDVEPGLVVKHSCDNPPCCNPAHLSKGTVAENAREAVERGLASPPPIRGPNKVCKNGHPMTPDNVYQYGDHRRCKPCMRQRERKYSERRNQRRREARRRKREAMKNNGNPNGHDVEWVN